MSNEVKKTENKFLDVAKKLNGSVLSVVGTRELSGFERAFTVSSAILELRNALSDEYMAPIMQLMGTKLGFRTDKDRNRDGSKGPGYPVEVVRTCLIEAVLMGLQPVGNQFNIIAGIMYPTKEGTGYLLNNFQGLEHDIVIELKAFQPEKKSATIEADITWKINGKEQNKKVPIPIKTDDYTTVDAVIGKGTRKARAWLLSTITGMEVTDGEVQDIPHQVIDDKKLPESTEEKPKPPLSEKAMSTAIKRIEDGEEGVLTGLEKFFELTQGQRDTIDGVLKGKK